MIIYSNSLDNNYTIFENNSNLSLKKSNAKIDKKLF